MKPVVEAAGGLAMASWVALGSGIAVFQNIIGPDAAMDVGLVVNVAMLFGAVALIFKAGGVFNTWLRAVTKASDFGNTVVQIQAKQLELEARADERHADHVERLIALERWRVTVDPIVTGLQVRLGVERKQIGGEGA